MSKRYVSFAHFRSLRSLRSGAAGNPQALIDWYNAGADGQIDWGQPGDFDQCVLVASAHMEEDDAKGFCNERHQDAVGGAPGSEDKDDRSKVSFAQFRALRDQERGPDGRWIATGDKIDTPAMHSGGTVGKGVDAVAGRGTDMSDEAIQNRLMAAWAASEANGTLEEDKAWYANAHEELGQLAGKLGVDPTTFSAVVAATSPQMPWGTNIQAAVTAVNISNAFPDIPSAQLAAETEHPGMLRNSLGNALPLIRGEAAPAEVLNAPKTASFFNNLAFPNQTDSVTIDGHLAQVILGDPNASAIDTKALVRNVPGSYGFSADQIRTAAQTVGVVPSQFMSVAWSVAARGDLPVTRARVPAVRYSDDQPRGADGRFGSGGGDNEMPSELGGMQWAMNGTSEEITQAAAGLCADPGRFAPDEDSQYHELAGQILDKIDASPPNGIVTYSGHSMNTGYFEDTHSVGDITTIPLMATSPDESLAKAYATTNANTINGPGASILEGAPPEAISAIENINGFRQPGSSSVVYAFDSDTRSVAYRENERLTSGQFEITSMTERPLEGSGKYLSGGEIHEVNQTVVGMHYVGPVERAPEPEPYDPFEDDYRSFAHFRSTMRLT